MKVGSFLAFQLKSLTHSERFPIKLVHLVHVKMSINFVCFFYFNQGRHSCPGASCYSYILNTYSELRSYGHNKQRFTYLHDDSRGDLRLTNVSIWKWNRHFLHQKDFDYCTKSKCIASQLIKWNCSFTIFLPEASYRSLLQKHLNNEELHWVL